jgi:methyl coenzyme M reductase gamma subunit
LRDRPKVGQRVEAFVFDLNTWTWDLAVTEYVGPTNVAIAGKTIKGFELRVEQGGKTNTVVVDAAGLPIVIDQGRVTMRRFS